MQINIERLAHNIESLAKITDPDHPYTRKSFTDLYAKGREWLWQQMLENGFEPTTDVHGNLIGTYKGASPEILMIGSHTDTVQGGGKYDGILGVLCGLEVLTTLKENNVTPKYTLELTDFLAEEISDYGLSCIGSRGMTGHLNELHLKYENATGETLKNGILRMGGTPDKRIDHIRKDIKAFLELHIEQGKVLEETNKDIGIVSSIVGLLKIRIVFTGEANHAGTTPMNLRKDAALAAARFTVFLNNKINEISKESTDYIVATVGKMDIEPNATNVIAGKAILVVDIRSNNWDTLKELSVQLKETAQDCAQKSKSELREYTILSNTEPANMDKDLQNTAMDACKSLEYDYLSMVSGAGHDAVFMSKITDSILLFVPSANGISHNPKEFTTKEAIEKGANTLLQTILNLIQ